MPYVLTKKTGGERVYLGCNDTGNHEWKADKLDAIRFDTQIEAHQCCGVHLENGAKIAKVNEWDGRYEAYKEHEIQVFKDDIKKPGGKRWRFRYGYIAAQRPYEYSAGGKGYNTPEDAYHAAQRLIDHKRVMQNT